MKRVLCALLAALLMLSVVGCGERMPAFSEDEMTQVQAFAEAAIRTYEIYSKENDLKAVRVLLTEDLAAALGGGVTFDKWDVSQVRAAVVFYIGPKEDSDSKGRDEDPWTLTLQEDWFPVITLLDGEKNVVYRYAEGDMAAAVAGIGAGEAQALRQQLAQAELDRDAYTAENGELLGDFVTTVEQRLTEDAAYLYSMDCVADADSDRIRAGYLQCCREAARLRRRVDILLAEDVAWDAEVNLDAEEELLQEKLALNEAIYQLDGQLVRLEADGPEELNDLRTALEAVQDKDEPLYEETYLRAVYASQAAQAYDEVLRRRDVCQRALTAVEEALATNNSAERRYILARSEAITEGLTAYNAALPVYVRWVAKQTEYEDVYADQLKNYATEEEAARTAAGANYAQDIEYMKVQLKYETVLNGQANLRAEVDKAAQTLEQIGKEAGEKVAALDADEEERLLTVRINEEKKAFRQFIVIEPETVSEYEAPADRWGVPHPDYVIFQNGNLNYYTPKNNGGGGEKCPWCNGTGSVKYQYGGSDLEAILNGHDPSWYGQCGSCGGTGRVKNG